MRPADRLRSLAATYSELTQRPHELLHTTDPGKARGPTYAPRRYWYLISSDQKVLLGGNALEACRRLREMIGQTKP